MRSCFAFYDFPSARISPLYLNNLGPYMGTRRYELSRTKENKDIHDPFQVQHFLWADLTTLNYEEFEV